jgi:transcriptional regulator with XRE-family HTH domain
MFPTNQATSVGPLLRAWRTARKKSQLALASEAGISSRHLSFLETGRASPSREMVMTLAETLSVPLRERNMLLEAAGFAPAYRETPLDAAPMAEVRHALSHILAASEPNPTFVVNRRYDVLLTNDAGLRLLAFFAPDWRGRNNMALLVLSPEGLKPALENWAEVAAKVVRRVRGELALVGNPLDAADEAILRAMIEVEPQLEHVSLREARSPSILVPVKLRRDGLLLEMFTTITTVGTPLDITLQELRIETLFPASHEARETLALVMRAEGSEGDVA